MARPPEPIAHSRGLALLLELRQRNVQVRVLTNSLASTDEPLVHYGYANHRSALLNAGVELHELMPSGEAASGEQATVVGSSGGGSVRKMFTASRDLIS